MHVVTCGGGLVNIGGGGRAYVPCPLALPVAAFFVIALPVGHRLSAVAAAGGGGGYVVAGGGGGDGGAGAGGGGGDGGAGAGASSPVVVLVLWGVGRLPLPLRLVGVVGVVV